MSASAAVVAELGLRHPLGPAFLTWAGWLLPYDQPLALIGDAEEIRDATRQLRLIGLDRIAGFWTPDVLDAWTASGRAPATLGRTDAAGLQARLARGDVQILDVRTPVEHAAGHIAVHCQGGLRSAIAAGLLDAHGRPDVLDLQGGFGAWQQAGLPVERSVPTPALDAVAV